VFVISALLNAADEIYEMHYDPTRNRPIKGYLQILNTLVFLGGAIVIVAILADKSPLVLLGGLGALTAILLLVFQDTITGFVASVQLQNYDVVRQGDWIEAAEYGADGEVVDVTLHTVKILNADRTMVTIPTSKLTQGGFTNWRPIYEGGGRRIMRSIRLDVSMVRFLTPAEVERCRSWELLHDWIEARLAGIEAEAAGDRNLPPGVTPHRRGITNIGAFRAYAEAFVRRHPRIHGDGGDLTALVRVKEATPDGVPVEVYAFATETGFEAFEEVQAEVFDHLLAIVPEFGLRVFQNPTGADMARLAGATVELAGAAHELSDST
jgi:miniconductance mechanosensitive channel